MADDDNAQSHNVSRGFEPGATAVPEDNAPNDDLMTDEERQYLDPNYEDTAEDDGPAAQGGDDDPDGGDDDPDGDDPDAGGDDDDDAAARAAEDDAKAKEAEAAKTADDKPADVEPDPAPQDEGRDWRIPDPSQYEAAITERETAIQQVRDDFEDGELTEAERDEKLKTLNGEIRQAQREAAKAEVRFEDWKTAFNSAVKSYAKEFPDLVDQTHYQNFDAYVRRVNSDPRDMVQSMSPRERLRYAHKLYANDAEHLGVEVPDVPPAKGKAKAKDPAPDPEKAKRDQLTTDKAKKEAGTDPTPPKTLASVPAAAINDDGGKFAEIDQISDPEAREAAINRLSPAERDLWLQQ